MGILALFKISLIKHQNSFFYLFQGSKTFFLFSLTISP